MLPTRFSCAPRAFFPSLLAAALLSACGNSAPPPPPPAAVPVSTLKVSTREVPVLIEAVGRTEGSKEVEVRARVSGILEKINYAEGTPVKAGTPLYRIDRAPFEIALAEARAALQQEQARHEQAGRENNRLKDLADKRAISRKESDDAGTTLKSSQATISAAEAKVREAELNLSYTTVIAPVAGLTSRNLRSEGTLVAANTDSALLTTISQTNPMWVRFGISDAEYEVLRATAGGAAQQATTENVVRLVLPSGKLYAVAGKLNFSGSTVDSKLGTVQLRAEFTNPDLGLLPGQFVRAQVVAGKQQAILVPQTAVQQNEQGRFVWVVGADSKAAQKRVEAGAWLGSDWIINKGLADGDVVILDNLLEIRPGAMVKPQQPGSPGGAPAGAPGGAPAADAKKAG
ncbi:MAG TPA: efflux RND transporter periplasmic adaptor subunit [Burkholderiales bacterium]|nr:efflux RND transporter periplasmic adaptor subunit [Burkholderiales bacterium]